MSRRDQRLGRKSAEHAEINVIAARVLGSKENARKWLRTPALALGQKRPIDLLETPQGLKLVRTLLVQLEFGVYV